jgi:hypothetical protein
MTRDATTAKQATGKRETRCRNKQKKVETNEYNNTGK